MGDRVIRVFPRRTRATPDDLDVRVAVPPGLFDEAAAVHVSVAFTYDLPLAERLARQWEAVGSVEVGGPALGAAGGEFEPGRYLRAGYVITSRGCPNRCWFCEVWRREGPVRELPIREGYNVLDDNLLACSDDHVRAVFAMLGRVEFTGGLEAARLRPWHAAALKELHPRVLFFVYDTPGDYEPLVEAGRLLVEAGFTRGSHQTRCYVLCGFPGDTMGAADERLRRTLAAGFTPMAMLYRAADGRRDPAWGRFVREWVRPAILFGKLGPGPDEAAQTRLPVGA